MYKLQLTLVMGPLVPHEIYSHKHESESTYICIDNSRISEKPFLVPLGFGGYLPTCIPLTLIPVKFILMQIRFARNLPLLQRVKEGICLILRIYNKGWNLKIIPIINYSSFHLKKCKNLENLKSQKCICRNVLCKLLNDLYICVHFYA